MSSSPVSTRLPWQDRWSEPTIDQLIKPHKSHHRRVMHRLMSHLSELEGVDRSVLWCGDAWKWTIHYRLVTDKGREIDTLCYVVPRVETPQICVPLSEAIIQKLPMRRLSKMIRDGVKMAKCAVAIHWATWWPNTQGEVDQLADLLRRKIKLTLAGTGGEQ